jgi:hypothetical protein
MMVQSLVPNVPISRRALERPAELQRDNEDYIKQAACQHGAPRDSGGEEQSLAGCSQLGHGFKPPSRSVATPGTSTNPSCPSPYRPCWLRIAASCTARGRSNLLPSQSLPFNDRVLLWGSRLFEASTRNHGRPSDLGPQPNGELLVPKVPIPRHCSFERGAGSNSSCDCSNVLSL